MSEKFEIKDTGWEPTKEGYRYEASITYKGRVIARASSTLSFDTKHDIAVLIGSEAIKEVESAVRAAAKVLAESSPA